MTVSVFWTPGFNTVFKSVLTMLWSGWFRFFPGFVVPPVFFPSLWKSLQAHQQQLVSPSSSYFTVFVLLSALCQISGICLYFCFLLFSFCGPLGWQHPLDAKFYFYWGGGITQGLFFLLGFSDLFVSQNPREFYGFHLLETILVCAYTLWLNSKVLISFRITSGSPFPPSRT